MTRLHEWARRYPDKLAFRMADSGTELTYHELDARANQTAQWFLSLGLAEGATIALLLENQLRTFELWWGARRAGLYYVPISPLLTAGEVAYILRDSGACMLLASLALAELASDVAGLLKPGEVPWRVLVDGSASGFIALEDARSDFARDTLLPERPVGREFMYSSGTTGFPKGIRRPLLPWARRLDLPELEVKLRSLAGLDEDAIFLCPSPLYHATARFNLRVIECGGSCVILPKFDAEMSLAAIARWRTTHGHWVPTMFARMLALPAEVRGRYDLSSQRVALHAAAPCPVPVKQAMIDWWGPIIVEYYGGSENLGVTAIDTPQWLTHRGSVGKPICGEMHILSDTDHTTELPPGEIGLIYFGGGVNFRYHNDAGKTESVFNARGWGTYGDLGHVDADGYLYISDRRTDLIISGGVNIYPQESENVLAAHPAVADLAVIGVPNADFGQEVKAVVQLRPGHLASPGLAAELLDWCHARLSRIKCPRSVEFAESLPRNENGKLLKRVLRDQYASSSG